MAARINTKFVIILLLILVTTGGIAATIAYYQIKQDAGRNARKGDAALTEGDLQKAREQYARAVDKEPGNREYLKKYEDVLLQLVPETVDRANELFEQRMAVLRHGAQHHPLDADEHLRLIEALHRYARLNGQISNAPFYYELLEASADNLFDRVHVDDPKRPYGQLYRAIARFNQRKYSAEELEESESDLQIFLDQFPDHEFGWASLITAQLSLADVLMLDGQTRRSEEKYDQAQSSIRTAVESGAEGLAMARVRFADMLQRSDRNPDAVTEDEQVEAFHRLLDAIQPDAPVWLVCEAISGLRLARSEELRAKVIEALERVMDAHPDHPLLRLLMAQVYYEWAKYDEAEDHLLTQVDAGPLPVGFLSPLQFRLKESAAGLVADVEYQRWVNATDDDVRTAQLAALESARDLVADYTSESEVNLTMARADGKLAFAKRDYATAAQRFEQLLNAGGQGSQRVFEHYAFAINSHEELGNIGLAHERCVLALQLRPKSMPMRLKKAELEVRMRRFDDAMVTLDDILTDAPDLDAAIRMRNLVQAGGDTSRVESDDPAINAMTQAQKAWTDGEREEARSILLTALDDAPENLNLLLMMARLELNDGNREASIEYADRGLRINPDAKNLLQLRELARNEDQIDAIYALARLLHPDDDDSYEAAKVVSFAAMVGRRQAQLTTLESSDDSATIQEARDELARAEQELEKSLNALNGANPDHPVLIANRFDDALRRQDWNTAEEYAERAGALNLDSADGDLFRSRVQLARGEYDSAVRTLLDVTTRMDYSVAAWRSLGVAYENLGRFTDAAHAYHQAYRANPTRLDVIQSYTRVLVQTGELIRALDVMQHARDLAPNDPDIRFFWLDLESTVGDSLVALNERRQWYESDPDNRNNAIRLAAMLGRLEPDQVSILDEDGSPRFNEREWLTMAPAQRETIVEQEKLQWQQEADQIVAKLSSEAGLTLELAALQAGLMQARGAVSEGEQILRSFIEKTPENERQADMYIVLGRYLSEANRPAEAIEVLQTGLVYQEPENLTVDMALGDLLFSLNRKEEALKHFRRLLETENRKQIRLRAVETLAALGQLAEARSLLEEAIAESGTNSTTWLLSSAILEREGDELIEQGNSVEAQFKYQEFRNALDEAQRARPGDILPKIRLAHHLLRSFDRTKDQSQLEEAMRALSEADQISANNTRVSLVRVDVLRTMGDDRGAIAELSRVLEISPGESQARRVLVTMLVAEGNLNRAIEVAQRGISHNATLPVWHIQLGEIYLTYTKDPAAAVQPFMTALMLSPSSDLLERVARAKLMAQHPPQEVIDLVNSYPQFLQTDPDVMGILVRAFSVSNQPQAIESMLRQFYGRLDSLISQGVLDSNARSTWFRVARDGLRTYSADKVEALLMELSNNEPTGHEMSSMSFLYRIQGDDASRNRSLQLQEQALSRISDLPKTAQSPYYYDYGTMLIDMERYQDAADALRTSFEFNPEHALAYNNYAYLLAEHLGRPQEALEPGRKAAELQPSSAAVQDTYGWILYRLEDYDEAEVALRRSLDIQRSPATLLHLAEVLIAKGEYDQAMNGPLREVSESRPDAPTQAQIDKLVDDIQTRRARGE